MQNRAYVRCKGSNGKENRLVSMLLPICTHERKGGLFFPSPAVLKIIKATDIMFWNRVMDNDKGIVFDKMIDLKIQSAVIDQLGQGIFDASNGLYFDHRIGQESDLLP